MWDKRKREVDSSRDKSYQTETKYNGLRLAKSLILMIADDMGQQHRSIQFERSFVNRSWNIELVLFAHDDLNLRSANTSPVSIEPARQVCDTDQFIHWRSFTENPILSLQLLVQLFDHQIAQFRMRSGFLDWLHKTLEEHAYLFFNDNPITS
jgi:hypothetical protein